MAKRLLSTYSKQDPVTRTRKPISLKLLNRLLSELSTSDTSKYDIKLFTAVFTFMYHAALRVSEVTFSKDNSHNLSFDNIIRHSSSVKIKFASYKHNAGNNPTIKLIETGGITCPVRAITRFLKVRGAFPSNNMIFIHKGGQQLRRSEIASMLKDLLKNIHLNHKLYNTHSFRIGKATDMHVLGYTDSQIRSAGRWASDAFKLYLKPSCVVNC